MFRLLIKKFLTGEKLATFPFLHPHTQPETLGNTCEKALGFAVISSVISAQAESRQSNDKSFKPLGITNSQVKALRILQIPKSWQMISYGKIICTAMKILITDNTYHPQEKKYRLLHILPKKFSLPPFPTQRPQCEDGNVFWNG